MLKLYRRIKSVSVIDAATFGWLCVETASAITLRYSWEAATFGWLCVETKMKKNPR